MKGDLAIATMGAAGATAGTVSKQFSRDELRQLFTLTSPDTCETKDLLETHATDTKEVGSPVAWASDRSTGIERSADACTCGACAHAFVTNANPNLLLPVRVEVLQNEVGRMFLGGAHPGYVWVWMCVYKGPCMSCCRNKAGYPTPVYSLVSLTGFHAVARCQRKPHAGLPTCPRATGSNICTAHIDGKRCIHPSASRNG
eukprot:1148648-Pelagomonas_calceolata.AAC.12